MLRLKKRIKGLALATILLAVVLLAAIAVTIAMSSRSGNASSSQQHDQLFATNIMSQAQQFKTSFELALGNGLDITTVTHDPSPPVTNFSPASAGIISLIAPAGASLDPSIYASTYYWSWHGAGHLAQIMNVGSSAGNYLLEIDPLTDGVCQQINRALWGDPTIRTITSDGHQWMNDLSAVDASSDPVVDGKMEGCFYSPAWGGRNFYYKVVLVQ